MSQEGTPLKTLIIGSGPAGYTAAIYAARADLQPVLYTGMEPGGQLTTTTEVDNFPGYPDGVDGPAMMVDLQKQAERFGTEVHIGMATAVELSNEVGGTHKVTIDNDKVLEAKTIIIATGASAKYLGLPSEQRLRGGGVSACAVCDGFFYKGQEVAIVGGGDTAAEEATYLANICKKVTMLVRKDHMRASKAMQHRVTAKENIDLRYNSEIDEVLGDQVVEGFELSITKQVKKKKFQLRASLLRLDTNQIPIFSRINSTWMMRDTSLQREIDKDKSSRCFRFWRCARQGVSTGSHGRWNRMYGCPRC